MIHRIMHNIYFKQDFVFQFDDEPSFYIIFSHSGCQMSEWISIRYDS